MAFEYEKLQNKVAWNIAITEKKQPDISNIPGTFWD